MKNKIYTLSELTLKTDKLDGYTCMSCGYSGSELSQCAECGSFEVIEVSNHERKDCILCNGAFISGDLAYHTIDNELICKFCASTLDNYKPNVEYNF